MPLSILNKEEYARIADNFLGHAIIKAIEKEAEEIYEKAKEEMVKELEKRKDEVITGTVLNIVRKMDIQDYTNKLIITVSKE